ncbi:MAG TPA: hypothetical protein VIM59_16875 [Cellvibrio sp.]
MVFELTQVTTAMMQINQVTQQNAAAAEQLATAEQTNEHLYSCSTLYRFLKLPDSSASKCM